MPWKGVFSLDGALGLGALILLLHTPLERAWAMGPWAVQGWVTLGLWLSVLLGGALLMRRVLKPNERFFGFVLLSVSLPIGLGGLLSETLLWALTIWVWGALLIYPFYVRARAKGWLGFALELALVLIWVGAALWWLRFEPAPIRGGAVALAIGLSVLPVAAYLLKAFEPFGEKSQAQSFALLLVFLPWVGGVLMGVDALWLWALSWLGISLWMAPMQQRMSYDLLVLLPWMLFLGVMALLPMWSAHEAALTALYWQEWVFASVMVLMILMILKIEQRRKMTLAAFVTLVLGQQLLLPSVPMVH
jgi:hypothetical protein